MKAVSLSELASREIMPGFNARIIHSSNMTFVYWDIAEAGQLPEHHHPHEQVAHVLQGVFELTVDGVTKRLETGSVAVIPSNAIHSGRAITQCRIMDAFYPVREDYR